MEKIKFEYNIGAIDNTTEEIGFIPVSVKDIKDESLIIKALERSIEKLESCRHKYVIGVIDIIHNNKKLFSYTFVKFGNIYQYSKDNGST